MHTLIKTAAFALALSTGLAAVSPAFAGGFLADLGADIGLWDEDTADVLDGMNDALGNPVDHAFAAGVDMVVPGAGTALEGVWQFNQMNDQFAAPVGRPARPAPQIAFPSNGGFQPAPTFQQAMGNVCYSQAGAFPGPFNPIGMPCTVMTPWGPVPGQVGR